MSAETPQPVSVLFVCLGNICRSPMAEGVFRSLTNNLPRSTGSPHPLISRIDSCGTGAYHVGDSPDPRTMSVLQNRKITTYRHAARKFQYTDFEEFDYIFAMDEENRSYLDAARRRLVKKGELSEGGKGRVMLFGECGDKGEEEVGDPYYGGRDGFEIAYEQVQRFSKGFLKMVEEKGAKK